MALPMLPSLQAIDRKELLSDPALRELYFGSTDTPGIIAQATDAAQKSILDQPAILQETAGLSPDEIRFSERILSPYLEKFGFECIGSEEKIESLLNSLSKHPSTKLMFSNYLKTGGGLELFPTNPNQ